MAKLITVPTSGIGLHATSCPIGLTAHNGNDCHGEKNQNTAEYLIRRIVRRLPIDDIDAVWFDFQGERVWDAFG
jgi:hypothetical protein